MSDWGKTNMRFIFLEGYDKETSWDKVVRNATYLRDKVFEAAREYEHLNNDEEQCEYDDTIQQGQFEFDDGHKIKCCHFMMGERSDNLSREYILNNLKNKMAPDLEVEFGYEFIVWICKTFHCACDMWHKGEWSLFAWVRDIYGPDGTKYWHGEQDANNDYKPDDILTNPKWEDVLGKHYEECMIASDLNTSQQKSKTSEQQNPDGRYVIFFDELIDTVTGESVDPDTFGYDVISEMFNTAPSEVLKKKHDSATHVIHTPMGYDFYFHVGVG